MCIKKAPSQLFSYKFCKAFKSTCFIEHTRETASVRTPRDLRRSDVKKTKLEPQVLFQNFFGCDSLTIFKKCHNFSYLLCAFLNFCLVLLLCYPVLTLCRPFLEKYPGPHIEPGKRGRSSHLQVFYKLYAVKNFGKTHRRTLALESILDKVEG